MPRPLVQQVKQPLSAYLLTFDTGLGWDLAPDFVVPRNYLALGTDTEEWTKPDLSWPEGGRPRPDVTAFYSKPEFDALKYPGMAEILARTGDLLPLGGEANGRVVFQPREWSSLQDLDRITGPDLPAGWLQYNQQLSVSWAFHEDLLVANTVMYDLGLGLLAIEDESEPPLSDSLEHTGLRRWCRDADVTGLRFKRIWSVTYDAGWFYKAVLDPSLWD